MKEVHLFNTMSRKVELLRTIDPGVVKLYCCGPTVYNYQHIGNLRTYVFEDVLVRTLRYAGYNVKHVMNITDVGHLVSDADDGEDKMAVASKREGRSSHEIADFYTKIFFDHCNLLRINKPDVTPKATDHIPQMIELIKRLENNGVAYFAGGNVYFDVSKFKEYGKLAQLDLESLKAGARIEVDKNKRNVHDFALWFTKSKFEDQELQWDSPWGRGYPGWHIECSAMSMCYLGEEFDIHCGGIDHIPVHHTNEIAQSEAATHKTFSRIWMHGGFLVSDKEKMSKSTGGFLTLDTLSERKIEPISYRLLCLSGHYRGELNWSWEAVEGANNSLKNLKNSIYNLRDSAKSETAFTTLNSSNHLADFEAAIFNDLNAPKALAALHATLADSKLAAADKLSLAENFDQVLGLGIKDWKRIEEVVPEEVLALAHQRHAARANKDFKLADDLRKQLQDKGYSVEDTKDGPVVKKN